MITIDPDAAAYIKRLNAPVYVSLPKAIRSCCFGFQEGPSVNKGMPHDPENYEERIISGISLLVSREIPEVQLTIYLQRFLGFSRLIVEGWRYC
ncbi:MAG: hypothetical protein LLF86_07820 [Nitrospiraceae bacterium]|nr:hypothetical protein [Nitrospiraceae bacterium]